MGDHREGGCACGAVRYRPASEALFVHCSHCGNCRRQTGSAFVIDLLIETDFDEYDDETALWPAASLERARAPLGARA